MDERRRGGREAAEDPGELTQEEFGEVVRLAPLIAIDLLVFDASGRVLLGLRRNRPAEGFWFVPGGRIRKGETILAALHRLAMGELGAAIDPAAWQFRGVAEHFYGEDAFGRAGTGTHYVTLAYATRVDPESLRLPPDQHRDYRWWSPTNLLSSGEVHPNTRAYFDSEWSVRWGDSG